MKQCVLVVALVACGKGAKAPPAPIPLAATITDITDSDLTPSIEVALATRAGVQVRIDYAGPDGKPGSDSCDATVGSNCTLRIAKRKLANPDDITLAVHATDATDPSVTAALSVHHGKEVEPPRITSDDTGPVCGGGVACAVRFQPDGLLHVHAAVNSGEVSVDLAGTKQTGKEVDASTSVWPALRDVKLRGLDGTYAIPIEISAGAAHYKGTIKASARPAFDALYPAAIAGVAKGPVPFGTDEPARRGRHVLFVPDTTRRVSGLAASINDETATIGDIDLVPVVVATPERVDCGIYYEVPTDAGTAPNSAAGIHVDGTIWTKKVTIYDRHTGAIVGERTFHSAGRACAPVIRNQSLYTGNEVDEDAVMAWVRTLVK